MASNDDSFVKCRKTKSSAYVRQRNDTNDTYMFCQLNIQRDVGVYVFMNPILFSATISYAL